MPIRFQVEGDFYDHPKAIGMSDAATALWVRAGSYSVAKLSDGFIPENALSLLSRCPEEAAGELVMRGLWRRVKGGFRFHQWSPRNLTRARVEADREADRLRKRSDRKTVGQNVKPQVDSQIVEPESAQDSGGIPPGVRPLSVSVSVSESVSGSGLPPGLAATVEAATGPEPPPRCPKHLDDPTDDPCRACGDARQAHVAWATDQPRLRAARAAARQQQTARNRAEAARLAIAACHQCDGDGYLGGLPCPHDPAGVDRTRRGAAQARAAITKEPAA